MTESTDFDLHGLAGVRLLDATEDDVVLVQNQLGLPPSSSGREPDIVIRFVDRLPTSTPLRHLGLDDVGFTDDAFLVLRGKHKSPTRAQIPLEQIGKRCEIICERGLQQVPLLIPILNLTVLGRGVIPLHASAFEHDGVGWVATGWSKGGKTETLLSFMANGATYIGDEWVYLTSDGSRMYGIPEPIRMWSWHLRQLPQYRRLVSRAARARLRALGLVVRGIERLSSRNSVRPPFGTRTLHRVRPLLAKQLCVDMCPRTVFGTEACRPSGVPAKILFVVTHEAAEVTVRRIDPREVSARMSFSLQYEQMNFMAYYRKFRFAFPDRTNDIVEKSADLQREILAQAVAGKEAFEVRHPYPVAIPSLFEAIQEHCGRP